MSGETAAILREGCANDSELSGVSGLELSEVVLVIAVFVLCGCEGAACVEAGSVAQGVPMPVRSSSAALEDGVPPRSHP